ncbi:leucine Rich Repeat [Seminavis robusta]|uniref:Leucine Rich Repeat n=1 Tax=Seminavis robusta TaxID=568900 RepID=A0A9N8DYF1_9STRA|nr:leucine Rich Repeat [Seminavis robusta]|eukprot:Sro451_g145730.1 leucine Rich Repeat (462) ;mRNA; r:44484-46025
MAPTTTRDAVVAPKIETVLTSLLGKDYFKQVEEGDDSDTTEFMLESRQKAFDWIVNQDPLQLEYASPNLVQRFLLVLFYYQTTRHEPWKECNPPSTFQGGTPSDFCYKLDPVTGETTSDIWGDQWLTKSHECQWAGMICETVQTKAKTVVGVSVRWNRLNGPLPWEIAQLPHLKQLHLNDNMLSGMLPPKLLSYSLERLQLGNNQLSGHIPAIWFENLHDGNAKLTSLQIDENWLTGTIPSEVGLFPMEVVHLHQNQLSGSLPVELSAHTSLKILLLGYNDLTGTVPSEFGLLTSLKGNLYLGHTHISGTLPSEIALLSTLQDIDLSSTNMQGTLPQEMYTGLTDLRAFSGNNCNFSGTISSSLGLLTSLVWLRLANNNFHGTIPSEIEELTSLMHLVVNGNQLTGTVPASLCLSAAFVEIYGAALVADCLPNQETGLPTIVCAADCCTSCCDNTGVCLGN